MTDASVVLNASIYGPTQVKLFHEHADGICTSRTFTPSCEWVGALRWHLIESKHWRMLRVFSVTDKSLEIQFDYQEENHD